MKNIKIPHHCVCPLAMSWKACNHTQMHKCNTWSHTHRHACACARTCARIYTDTHIWVIIVYSNQYNAITTSAREGAWKYYLQNVTPTCCCWKPTIITALMHSGFSIKQPNCIKSRFISIFTTTQWGPTSKHLLHQTQKSAFRVHSMVF